MTAYSNIINKAVEGALSQSGFNARELAPTVYSKISGNDRKRTSLATIAKDLREAANSFAKSAMKELAEKQLGFSFLQLPGAIAVDDDGSKIKLTLSLSRLEVRKSIERRQTKHSSTGAILGEMEHAEQIATPYWNQHPEWTFGQCLQQAAADRQESDAA